MLTVGGLGGTLETGRVLDYFDRGNDNRRICSMYLALMDRMGVKLDAVWRRGFAVGGVLVGRPGRVPVPPRVFILRFVGGVVMKMVRALGFAAIAIVACCEFAAAQGNATPPTVRFSKRRLFASPCEGAAIADLNKDGAPDIIYGAYWFSGPEFTPHPYRPNHLAAEYIHTNSDHPLDVDGDGWTDILSCAWGEEGFTWYKNPGDRATPTKEGWTMYSAWEPHHLANTPGSMEMCVLHDYDGDGTPEIHCACYRREVPLEVWRFTKDAAGAPALRAVRART